MVNWEGSVGEGGWGWGRVGKGGGDWGGVLSADTGKGYMFFPAQGSRLGLI